MGIVEDAITLLKGANLQYIEPDADEVALFEDAFNRMFILEQKFREMDWFYNQYKTEAMAGLMVMKKQTGGNFGGATATGDTFGIRPISPYNFTMDQWSFSLATASGVNNWIDAATGILSGTAGQPLKIGEGQVLVVCGYRSYATTPTAYALKVTEDGEQKPRVDVTEAMLATELKTQPLQDAYFWKKNTTVLVELFNSSSAASTDSPAFLGFSFVKGDLLRLLDAQNAGLSGADYLITT